MQHSGISPSVQTDTHSAFQMGGGRSSQPVAGRGTGSRDHMPSPKVSRTGDHPEDAALARLEERFRLRWQWYDHDWGTWTDYAASQIQVIEAAWQLEKTSVNIDDDDWPDRWVVNLVSMTQSPLEGDTMRSVRRILITHD